MRVEKHTTIVNEAIEPENVEEKKVLFRANQVVWYIFNFITLLLAFRFLLKALGANSGAGFTVLIYSITNPLMSPFVGILPSYVSGRSVIEWSVVLAILVYLLVALGINYILDLLYPLDRNDVEGRI